MSYTTEAGFSAAVRALQSAALRRRLGTAAQALARRAAEKLTPQRVYVRTAAGYEEMGG